MLRLIVIVASVISVSLLTGQVAVADCYAEEEQCLDDAETNNDGCWESCDRRHEDNLSRWDRCTDRCDENLQNETRSCKRQIRSCDSGSDTGNSAIDRYGSRESGEDGCYFGECPDGTSTPKREPSSRPPPSSDRTSPEVPEFPQTATSICQTPAFWCQMYTRGPVGSSCYCNSFYGPVDGMTVTE